MRWLGTPGAFSHCLAALTRAAHPAYLFEFLSYADRYAAAGLPVHEAAEIRPYYPWSLAWRDEELTEPVAHFLDIALETARPRGWQQAAADAWLPPDDPVLPETRQRVRHTG